jgi:hypothetical protein
MLVGRGWGWRFASAVPMTSGPATSKLPAVAPSLMKSRLVILFFAIFSLLTVPIPQG